MKIRWKLLILLLVVAVIPIIAVRVIDALTMYRYGKDVAARSRAYLYRAAELELTDMLTGHSDLLSSEDRSLHLMLKNQAKEIETRYIGPVPTDHDRVYDSAQFRPDADDPPPGLHTNPRYSRLRSDGTRVSLPISNAVQAVRVHPEADRPALADDIARLADMTGVYRDLGDSFGDLILWQYTSLESGAHFSYPGKGGYDPDYDPRRRLWYDLTKRTHTPGWYPPSYDATTGRIVLTLAWPLEKPDGGFLGVTAVDVPLGALIAQPTNSAAWSEASGSITLMMAPLSQLREFGFHLDDEAIAIGRDEDIQPVILLDSDGPNAGGDWRQTIELSVLQTDDAAEMATIRDDFLNQRRAVREVMVGGERMVWAYGPIDETGQSIMLITVPYAEIIREADTIEQAMMGEMRDSLRRSAIAVAVVIAIVIGVALLASRAISRPVMMLSNAAQRIADGQLDTRVDLRCHRNDELHQLAEAFNDMVPKLRDRMEMRNSLQLAMEVQQALLPQRGPAMAGFDIAGHSIYCDETGGDYYDFIDYEPLGPERMIIIVGDVVGHGIAAALLMATVRALVRIRSTVPSTLADAIADVNLHLCQSSFTGRFMTAFCLIIDKGQNKLRWVSAGHDPAIVYDPDGDSFSELEGKDIPIGLESGWTFNECYRDGWKPGEVIVLGTDGIWECRNEANDMFGKDRLRELIRRHADEPAQAIADAIQREVRFYRGQRAQQDDITLVVIKVTG